MYLFSSLYLYVQNGWRCAGGEDGKRGGARPGQQQRQDGEAYRNSQQSGRDLEPDKIKVLFNFYLCFGSHQICSFFAASFFLQIRISRFSFFKLFFNYYFILNQSKSKL